MSIEIVEPKEEWRECHLYFVRVKLDVSILGDESVSINRITVRITNTNVSWTTYPNITIHVTQSKEFKAILHPKLGLIYYEHCETYEIEVEVEAIIHYKKFGNYMNWGTTAWFSAKVRICGSG